MTFKLLVAIMVTLICSSCVSTTPNDNARPKTDYELLGDLLRNNRTGFYVKENGEYLIQGIMENEEVKNELIHRRAFLRSKVFEMQESGLVCKWGRRNVRLLYRHLYYGEDAVARMSNRMLARVSLLLDHFLFINNVRRMGAMLETDFEDINNKHVVPTEIGGLGLLWKGEVVFLPIPSNKALGLNTYETFSTDSFYSVSDLDRFDSNGWYFPPEYSIQDIRSIFVFHLHAVKRPSGVGLCGPSFRRRHNPDKPLEAVSYIGDIVESIKQGKTVLEWHQVVISGFKKRTFSVHYIGAEKNEDGIVEVMVVNLPIKTY